MSGYGRDESAPTPGGMFATNFVGERNIIANRSQPWGPIHRARVYVYTHEMGDGNAYSMKWICVFDDVNMRI